MMNYIRSEGYRLIRKKGLYITLLVCLGFIGLLLATMAAMGKQGYYQFVILLGAMACTFIAIIMNNFLTGNDCKVLKQSVAYGISRQSIFFTKFGLTLLAFLVLCTILIGVCTFCGESLFSGKQDFIELYWLPELNLLPIFVSMMAFSHVLNIFQVNSAVTTILVLFIYRMSGVAAGSILRMFSINDSITKYFPNALMDKAFESTAFIPSCWIISGIITVVCLFIGGKVFQRKDIA